MLSVPVTALLATGGGNYAVQEATAPHQLIPVTTGLFAAGYVEISGSGIYPGLAGDRLPGMSVLALDRVEKEYPGGVAALRGVTVDIPIVAAGAEVRALVRRPCGFAGLEGVQVVQGSFDDDRSLARALEGVDVMLLVGRDSPDFGFPASARARARPSCRGAAHRQAVRYWRIPQVSNSVDARAPRNRRRNPRRSSRLDPP